MNEVYAQIADIMEVDEVKPDDVLTDFPEWDSLTVLSVIAMLDAKFGINITAMDIRNFKTAGELVSFLANRKTT